MSCRDILDNKADVKSITYNLKKINNFVRPVLQKWWSNTRTSATKKSNIVFSWFPEKNSRNSPESSTS